MSEAVTIGNASYAIVGGRDLNVHLSRKLRYSQAQSVLEMSHTKAKQFLLKPESYCSIDFPPYLRFNRILSSVVKAIGNTRLESMRRDKPRDYEEVNYPLLTNKDGRHAWRPLQLIHPALYVSLVNIITTKNNWELIKARFSEFQALPNFRCLSIPVQSRSNRKDRAAQILHWWQGVEQRSIELALDYAYVLQADIANCYAAIYTHSISWALHGRLAAKANPNAPSYIGNLIDWHIQDMRRGQTNGIPQGSTLMDLISEIVLGYADLELYHRLDKQGISDYHILRYRDDYRIFVNNTQAGETILKNLTEVMIELGLQLNTRKTTGSQPVVSSALKPDKLAWLRSRQGDRDLQKHLLVIHAHGIDYPNAGSMEVALYRFHERLNKVKKIRNHGPLISIVADIAFCSPRTFPVCAAIISKILRALKSDTQRKALIHKVHRKLTQLPNTGHIEIWLQRISFSYGNEIAYTERLCGLVKGEKVSLWNNEWISSRQLKQALDPKTIVDEKRLKALNPVVLPEEISVFSYERY